MEGAAKLITALGALLGAIAWPIAILLIAIIFRKEVRTAAGRLPHFIDRMRKMKIAGIEAELDQIADASTKLKSGEVTLRQIEAATKIAVEADQYDEDLLIQLDRLCLEYDAIRRSMEPGSNRTQAMTRIIVKMRALAPALVQHIDLYKGSGSAGSRLAAVAMMQMNPNAADIDWLAARFVSEQPFLFYHAALALQNLANDSLSKMEWDQLLGVTHKSLEAVRSFGDQHDKPTIEVLEKLIGSIRQ